jgi:hypothetical protein
MLRRSRSALACWILVPALALGCAERAPEPTTPAPAPSSATASETAPQQPPAPEGPKRKPFEIYSNCGEVVTVVFGADPKAPNAGKRTIAPSAGIDGPRDNDGGQTVWLLDASNEPLVKVQVTRGMKRVEVGKSCRTLDAR